MEHPRQLPTETVLASHRLRFGDPLLVVVAAIGGAKYVGRMGTNSSSLKCSLCSWKWNDGSCSCSVWFLIFDSTNQFCIDASYDPHGSGSSTTFSCNTGYMWSQAIPLAMVISPHQTLATSLALLPAIPLHVPCVILTQATSLFLEQKFVYFAPPSPNLLE